MPDVPFQLVDSVNHQDEDGVKAQPGQGKFSAWYGEPDSLASLLYHCPGCGKLVSCSIKPRQENGPSWEFSGTKEQPTLKPSIIHDKTKGGCGWHGWLTNGVFSGNLE